MRNDELVKKVKWMYLCTSRSLGFGWKNPERSGRNER